MSMQDLIADMLARIRNAQMAEKVSVSMPSSKTKVAIANVLFKCLVKFIKRISKTSEH